MRSISGRPDVAFLKVADLNSYYGQSHVLYDVSLSIEAGGLVALIRRNGAGKSATLNSTMELVTPRSGR